MEDNSSAAGAAPRMAGRALASQQMPVWVCVKNGVPVHLIADGELGATRKLLRARGDTETKIKKGRLVLVMEGKR